MSLSMKFLHCQITHFLLPTPAYDDMQTMIKVVGKAGETAKTSIRRARQTVGYQSPPIVISLSKKQYAIY